MAASATPSTAARASGVLGKVSRVFKRHDVRVAALLATTFIASVLVKVLDHRLFDDSDAAAGEFCMFGAAAVGLVIFMDRQAGPKAKGAGGARGLLGRLLGRLAQGRGAGCPPGAGAAAEEPDLDFVFDTDLVRVVVEACHAGDFIYANKRFKELLAQATSKKRCAAYPVQGTSSSAAVQAVLEACAKSGGVDAATSWVRRLRSVGARVSGQPLFAVLDAMAPQGELCPDGPEAKRAEAFILEALALGCKLDVACYQVLFERCLPPRAEGVERWLQRLARQGRRDQLQGYVALIRARTQTHTADQADQWMTRALEACCVRTAHLYNAAIHACARAGNVERALHWLGRLEEEAARGDGEQQPRVAPDVISFSAIMDAYAQQGLTEQTDKMFKRMVAAGVAPDSVSYNTVIKAYTRAMELEGAIRWIDRARAGGVKIDAYGRNAVIAAAARACDAGKAERLLLQMLRDGIKPDVVSYNSVINAMARSEVPDSSGADRIVNLMIDNGVEPDVVTLTVSVHACARVGDKDRAEKVFQRITGRGHALPDAICFNALINASVKAGDIAASERWLAAMIEAGVPPSVVSHTTVLHAHAKLGDIAAAERGMERMLRSDIAANVVSYSALVHACVKAGDVARAEKWFQRMRSAGISANVVSYSSLLNVCAKANDYIRAETWLQRMFDDGVEPNVVCFNNIIDACAKCRQPQRAEAWLYFMMGWDSESEKLPPIPRPQSLEPTSQSFTTAAQAYSAVGAWSEVERIISVMEKCGLEMDEFSLSVLLGAYSRARPRQRERAEAVFAEHVRHGRRITKAPLRVLRSILGAPRFKQVVEEAGSEGLASLAEDA